MVVQEILWDGGAQVVFEKCISHSLHCIILCLACFAMSTYLKLCPCFYPMSLMSEQVHLIGYSLFGAVSMLAPL